MAVIAREIARTSPLRTFSAHSLTSQLMCVLVDRESRKRAGAFPYYLFPRRYKATGKSHGSHDCRLSSAPYRGTRFMFNMSWQLFMGHRQPLKILLRLRPPHVHQTAATLVPALP